MSDGSISAEALIIEFAKQVVTSIAGKHKSLSFRLIRQSVKSVLSPQDRSEILLLYRSMLSNPQVTSHRHDYDTSEDVERCLKQWADYPISYGQSGEQVLIVADYDGHIVSFLYGVLRCRVFFLWYLVGPKNILFNKAKLNYNFPPTIETAGYTQAIILKLLGELHSTRDADSVVFAVGATAVRDTKSVERSRLRLFNQVEQETLKSAQRLWPRLTRPVLKKVSGAYVLDFPFYQPMFHGNKVEVRLYSLNCIPISAAFNDEVRSCQVSHSSVKNILEAVYPTFYLFLEPDDPDAARIKRKVDDLMRNFDRSYTSNPIGCCELGEFLNSFYGAD